MLDYFLCIYFPQKFSQKKPLSLIIKRQRHYFPLRYHSNCYLKKITSHQNTVTGVNRSILHKLSPFSGLLRGDFSHILGTVSHLPTALCTFPICYFSSSMHFLFFVVVQLLCTFKQKKAIVKLFQKINRSFAIFLYFLLKC